MPASIDLTLTRTPSLFGIFFSVLRGHRKTFDPAKPFPVIAARRDGIKPEIGRLRNFARVCSCSTDLKLPLIYPMTYIYPIIQIVLAHREAPLSLAKALNTRMKIVQHRPITVRETFDVSCRLAANRVLEKGLEVDIACLLQFAGQTVWESTMTFYYRGKFGAAGRNDEPPQLEGITDAPEIARWFLSSGIGFSFSRLSGDVNPLHFSKFYARLSGFERDFAQPLLVLAKTLSRFEAKDPSTKYQLDIAIKGPVYYERDVIVKSVENMHGERFDIYSAGNPRPCISGNLQHN